MASAYHLKRAQKFYLFILELEASIPTLRTSVKLLKSRQIKNLKEQMKNVQVKMVYETVHESVHI